MSLLLDLDDESVSNNTTSYFDGEIISIVDTPPLGNWGFDILYKNSQTGGLLLWQIWFDSITSELVIHHGYEITPTGEKGSIQIDRTKIISNNSGRSIVEQALLQARKRYQDKIKDYYFIGNSKSLFLYPPQLANKYTYSIVNNKIKSQINEKHLKRGIACQYKIDGIRARIWKTEDGIKIYSRKNEEFKWLSEIKKSAELLFDYLPSGCGIDAELYNPNMLFEQIISAVRTTLIEHQNNKYLYCYIFDIILPNEYLEKRIKILQNAFHLYYEENSEINKFILLHHTIVHTYEDIQLQHDQAITQGYEGIMLRKCIGINNGFNLESLSKKEIEETWYKGNRNNNLLKYKSFIDEEGYVIDVKHGEGREQELAIFTIQMIDENKKILPNKIFDCRPKGSFEIRKQWLLEKYKCIGKLYTYRYFELTAGGIPRHPVGIAFRDYE